jgi:putative metalloprotease
MNPKITLLAAALLASMAGCAIDQSERPAPRAPAAEPATVQIDKAQAERLRAVMLPLLARMDQPLAASEVKVGVWDDPRVNAANAGGGAFFVTTGLLERASEDQLRGIMAHEIAHADLGHVAKTQTLAAGLEIGTFVLDQILPGSGAIAPIASRLAISAYTRSEESAADAHAVTLMKRAGHDGRRVMGDALTWIARTEGESGGGFMDSHPTTADRIQAIKDLPQ